MRESPHLAVVFSDASYCPRTGAAGWGAWLRYGPEVGMAFGGPVRSPVGNSSEAEICGAGNALFAAMASGAMPYGTRILLQVDNLRALTVLKSRIPGAAESRHPTGLGIPSRTPSPTPIEASVAERLAVALSDRGSRLILRHVKGHRRVGARGFANSGCDETAKRHMDRERTRKSAPR